MHLEVVAPPNEEPVSLEEAKLHLRVDGDDENNLIGALIIAARLHVEEYCGIALITQTLQLTIDAFAPVIRLPRPPFSSVSAINYVDADGEWQLLSDGGPEGGSVLCRVGMVSMGAAVTPVLGSEWPSTACVPGAVQIRYEAGYGSAYTVPQSIKQAILLLIGHWYKTREAVGEQLSEPPFAVTALLAKYVVPVV